MYVRITCTRCAGKVIIHWYLRARRVGCAMVNGRAVGCFIFSEGESLPGLIAQWETARGLLSLFGFAEELRLQLKLSIWVYCLCIKLRRNSVGDIQILAITKKKKMNNANQK